jgi:hypothetical protein
MKLSFIVGIFVVRMQFIVLLTECITHYGKIISSNVHFRH